MITKLIAEMNELEASVDDSMSKEELYDVLVLAYYKAKDVIELQQAHLADDSSASTIADLRKQIETYSVGLAQVEKIILSM